jgi:branched-chain amino acid transport system substrate-binding protein
MGRFAGWGLVVLLAAALLAPAAHGQDVVVAVVGPMTGDAAQYGIAAKRAVELFANEVNEEGGLLVGGKRRRIKVIVGDDKADPKEAASVATKFASNKKVAVVIGHFNSSCCLAGKPIYARYGVVEFSYGCTNSEVAKGSPWTFRNVFEDTFQGQSVANYARNALGLERVAVFFDNDDYGRGLKDSFAAQAEKVGLTIVGQEAYDRESVDFRAQLTKLRQFRPQAIFISGLYNQGGLIASQTRQLGMKWVQILGADGLASDEYIRLAGPSAEGTIVTSPFLFELGGTNAKEFAEKFKKRYGVLPDWIAANAYDSIGMVSKTVEDIGSADRQAIRDALAAKTSREEGYTGITGVTFFDENGDCQKPVFMQVVKGNAWVAADKQME